ncbi:MAG: inverse autotransporter beta domain-containing protein [Pseudomonadota bacterium]
MKRWLTNFPPLAVAAMTALVPTIARADNEPNKATDQTSQELYNWVPWFEMGAYSGNVRARGEAALWAPLLQTDDALIFTDIRLKAFEEDAREGNFALGYRQMFDGYNLGLWGGFDTRESQLGSRFNQISGGVELLSHDFDFRANGYLPLNKSEVVSTSTTTIFNSVIDSEVVFDEGLISIFNTETIEATTTSNELREHAMYGVDAEVGVRLPLELAAPQLGFDPSIFNNADVRVYAGGYYFDSPDIEEEILGTRMRLEVRFEDIVPNLPGSRLTAEAEYQYDDVRDHQYEFGVRLRIPFYGQSALARVQKASLNSGGYGFQPSARQLQARRMTDGLERDTDVVHDKKSTSKTSSKSTKTTTRERALDAKTGVELNRLTFINANQNFNDAILKAGSNSLIIASGSAGEFVNQYATLLPDQTLIGGGTKVDIVGSQTHRKLSFVAPGMRPTLTQTDNASVLVVNTNTHVAGLNINGGGADAGTWNRGVETFSKHTSGMVIDDVDITNTGGHGVHMTSYTTNYTLNNLRISNVARGNGIDIEADNTGFAITNTTISDIDGRYNDAILFARRNEGLISNVSFGDNIQDAALRVTSNNVLSGTGNTVLEGQRLCEQFEGGNVITVSFNGIVGCD